MPARISTRPPAPEPLTGRKTRILRLAVLLALALCLLPSAGPVQADSSVSESAFLPFQEPTAQTVSPQGQAEPAPPNPLIYLDIWLFGGLILLVALIVGVKYLWKAFQPDDRDPSEGLQPWERPDYDDEQR